MHTNRDRERSDEKQTWGQGEGRHEATLPDEEPTTAGFADGRAHNLDDPELPLSRDDEGMDR